MRSITTGNFRRDDDPPEDDDVGFFARFSDCDEEKVSLRRRGLR